MLSYITHICQLFSSQMILVFVLLYSIDVTANFLIWSKLRMLFCWILKDTQPPITLSRSYDWHWLPYSVRLLSSCKAGIATLTKAIISITPLCNFGRLRQWVVYCLICSSKCGKKLHNDKQQLDMSLVISVTFENEGNLNVMRSYVVKVKIVSSVSRH